MNPANASKLRARVVSAAATALSRQSYVSAIDVLIGIGWLDPSAVDRRRRGQLSFLEGGIQTNLARISEAMRCFHAWAAANQLRASETAYISRTPDRAPLRFSESGDATIERLYRTHWVSPKLSEKKQKRLDEAASRPPELVVISPLESDWTCHRCGHTGDLLIMEPAGPSCLPCAGLGGLVYLAAGDAGLSRRAKAKSTRYAVVVRFSRTRKRYERQWLLVEAEALRAAERAP